MTLLTRSSDFRCIESVIFSTFLIVLLISGSAVGSPVPAATVSPGSPSTLEIQSPASVKAGGDFSITIRVLDEEGNVVRNYSELNREILLNTTGDGELSRSVVSSDQFSNGTATVELSYTKAEQIKITARERNHVATGQSDPITVRAGELSEFEISVPDKARAGREFAVQIQAFDQFGNPIRNYAKQTNGVSLGTTGLENPKPEFLPAKQFENGQLRTLLTYTVAEKTRIVVKDEVNGVRTVSDTIQIEPGRLHNFTLSVPETAEAGEPFRTAIEARDKFGNIVRNYDELGQGVQLSVPAGAQPEPSYVEPNQFDNGVAFVEVTYTDAGPIKLRVRDTRSSVEGESSKIQVQPGGLDHFSLTVPEQVKAGKEFTVEITALDNFGNTVRDVSEEAGAVKLTVRGSTETRQTVQPGAFENGRASVKFQMTSTGQNRLRIYSESDSNISGLSQAINVGPGPPGKITIDVPETARAGSNFTAMLVLKDKFGNVIRQPGFLEGEVRVSLVNHSQDSEQVFNPGQFINGRKRIVFSHNRAEEVSVFAEYRDYSIRNTSASIRILPGQFNQIAVNSPGSVQAGSSFNLKLTLLDRYGNQLRQLPDQFSSLKLKSTGSGNVEPRIISRGQMSAPTFSVPITYFVSETISVKILDSKNRQLGISAPVRVTPGPLDSFSLQTPRQVSADEKFTVRIEANDPYHNTITNLDKRSGSVRLETNTDTQLTQTRVQYGEFVNGVAEVSLGYHRAGDLRIIARTENVRNQSSVIDVNPGAPSSYEVLIQEEIQAGRPFPAVIQVYDRYGNSVTDLPDSFYGVKLKSEGQLSVHPNKVEAGLFSNGEANVYLAVTGTGDLSLSAVPLEKSLKNPEVDRFFISRQVDTATVSILSSGSLAEKTSVVKNSASGQIMVTLEPANLLVDERRVSFQGWFLNSITQKQTEFGQLPVVSLNIYPSEPVTLNQRQTQNLTQFTLIRKSTTTSATLREIQRLIQDQQFNKASKLLEKYLDDNPGDQDALQLRLRLKRLREVVGS